MYFDLLQGWAINFTRAYEKPELSEGANIFLLYNSLTRIFLIAGTDNQKNKSLCNSGRHFDVFLEGGVKAL